MDLVWDIPSLLFYIGIVLVTYILGLSVKFQKFNSSSDINSYNYFILAVIFFIFYFVSAFRNVGTDLPAYLEIFSVSNSKSDSEVYGIEPGFLLLNKFIYQFTQNGDYFIFIISFIYLFIIFFSLNIYKYRLNFSIVFLSFSTLIYFQSFSLVRVYLASALVLYSVRYLLNKQFFKFFICFIIISSIHYSTVLLLLPILGVFIYRVSKYFFFTYLLGLLIVIYVFSNYLILFNLTDRYTGYLESIDKTNSIGFGQFFFNFPILFLAYKTSKYNIFSQWQITIFIVFAWFSFFFGVLGYWIPTISRVNYLLSFLFLIFVPIVLNVILKHRGGVIIYLGFVFYIFIRFYIYMSALAFADGINSYSTIFTK